MKKKARKFEEDEEADDEEFDEEGGGAFVVGQIPTVSVPRHIKKRALKNKALAVGFSEKDLKDFVTGFHKRKKKRRKEAEMQLKEEERLKRIEARKRRKEEKERALYGGILPQPSAPEGEPNDASSESEEDEPQTTAPISETKTYESNYTTITVITNELSREDEDLRPVHPIPIQSSIEEKNPSLSVKKKPLKPVRRHESQKKTRKPPSGKKDKRSKNKQCSF